MRNLVWILFALVLFDCKQTNRRKSFESSNAPQFSAQALLNQAPVFNLVDGDFAPQKLSSLESLTIPENLFTKEGDLLVMERSIPDLEWFVNKAQSPSSSSRPTVQGAVMFHECRLDSAACKATALNTWLYFDYSWGYASTSQGGAIYGSRAVIVPKVRSNLGSSQVFARICVRREFIESSLKSSCSNSDSSRFCCGAARAWTFNFSNSSMTEAEKQAASKQYALDRELDSLATKVSSLSSWAVESFPIPSDLAEREKKQGYKLIFDIASYEPPTLAALLRYGLPVQGNSSEIQASFKLTDEPPAPSSESSDWYMSVISTDPTRGATLVVKSSQTKQGQVAGLDQENPFPQLIEQISAGETAPNNPGTGTTVGTPGTGTTVGTPETSTTGGTPGTGTTVGTPETSTIGGTRGTGTTVGTPETSTTGGTPEMSTTGGTPEMSTTGGTPGTNPVKTVVPPLYYALGSVAVIAGFVLTGFAVKAKFSNNMRVGPAVDFDPIVAPVETFQRERAAENLESKKIAEKTKSDKTKGISRSLGLGIAAGVTIAIGGAFIAGGVGIDRLALTSNNEDIYTDEMSAIQAALQANRQARQRSACLSCPVAYKPSLLSVLSNPKRSFFVGQDDELKTREPSQTAAQVYLPGSKIKFATKGSNFSCFIDQRDVVTCLDDSLNHTIRRLAVPKKLTAYRLAAGKSHVCAIKKSRDSSDRTVTCWGDENAKVVPTNLGSVRAISAFQGHSCAIKEDLSIQCWGGVPPSEEEDPFTCMNDDQSQCNLPGLPNGFKPGVVSTIHVGSNNLCILDINDRAHCWGWQKANPDEAAKWQALKLLPDLGALRSIIVTGKAACGIKKDRNQGLCWDLKVPSTTVDLGDRVRDLSIDGLNIDYLQADQILSKSLLTHSPHINLITVAPGFVCFIDSNKKLQCKRTDAVIPRDRRNDFNSNDPEGNGFNTSYIPNLPTELGDSSKLLKSIAWVSAIVIAPDSLPPYFYPDGQDPFHYPGALLAVTEDHLIRCVTTEPADRFQLPSPYLRCEPAELNTGFSNFTPISPLISAETACVLGTKTTTGGSITQSLYCWSIVDPRCGLRLAMLVPGLVGPQFDLRGTQIYSCNPKSSFTDSVLSASGPTISRDRRSIAPDSFYIVQADGTVVEHQIIWREHGIFRGGTAPDVTAFNPVSHANFKAKQVSVGTFHVCIIKQDNSVACRFKEGRQGSADFVDVPELGEAVKLVSFAFGGSFTAKPRGVFGVESVNGFCSIDKDSTVACVIEDIKEEDIKAEARYGSLVTTSPPSDLGRVRDLAGSLVSGEICALKESYDTQCWTPSFP